MADPRVKSLKIRTGVVKRLSKELCMYEKEVEEHNKKLEKMVNENTDEYVIKKHREVMEESRTMIPDTRCRLNKAIQDLNSEVTSCKGDFEGTEEFTAAQKVLEDANKQIETD